MEKKSYSSIIRIIYKILYSLVFKLNSHWNHLFPHWGHSIPMWVLRITVEREIYVIKCTLCMYRDTQPNTKQTSII